ncbi:MAG: ABC transporter permease [Thermoplasmata archaeon]|nr:ABC transporter permease [Thermoplasmata archaeon]
MSVRHRLRSLWTIAYMNGVIPVRRQPLYLLNTIASPLSFLFFIALASRGTLLRPAIAGGMVLTMISIGTSLQADLTHYKQDMKFQDLVVASPVEAPIYVAGLALSEFLYSIPGLSVFVALWVATGPVPGVFDAATVVGTLLLVWAFSSALGFTLATYFEDIRETFVFGPLVSLGLTVLPPVYYPATFIPAAYRPLAFLSPATYAADLLHRAFSLGAVDPRFGPPLLAAPLDWLALIAVTAALFLLAAKKARWREP